MCQVPSSQLQAQINHNKHITDKLEVIPPTKFKIHSLIVGAPLNIPDVKFTQRSLESNESNKGYSCH